MLIKDLSKELDVKALSAVIGGANDRGNSSVGNITQAMILDAPNLVAAGAGSSLTNSNNVSADQYATQYTNQNNGDFFGLFLGFPVRA